MKILKTADNLSLWMQSINQCHHMWLNHVQPFLYRLSICTLAILCTLAYTSIRILGLCTFAPTSCPTKLAGVIKILIDDNISPGVTWWQQFVSLMFWCYINKYIQLIPRHKSDVSQYTLLCPPHLRTYAVFSTVWQITQSSLAKNYIQWLRSIVYST